MCCIAASTPCMPQRLTINQFIASASQYFGWLVEINSIPHTKAFCASWRQAMILTSVLQFAVQSARLQLPRDSQVHKHSRSAEGSQSKIADGDCMLSEQLVRSEWMSLLQAKA